MRKIINHQLKKINRYKQLLLLIFKTVLFGILFILLLFAGYLYRYNTVYKGKIAPNVFIDNVPFGNKMPHEVELFWLERNRPFLEAQFTFVYKDKIATLSGEQLDIGYDATLSATQAYLIGRSGNITTDTLVKLFQDPINMKPFFRYKNEILQTVLDSFSTEINKPAQDALFSFESGRVTAFKPALNGLSVNTQKTMEEFESNLIDIGHLATSSATVNIVTDTIEPDITTDKANSFGIKELIGSGYSVFNGSIPGRIHNVALAATKFNGVLIAPDEVLSFNKTLGDVSVSTGYQPAYIIKNGRTVLGDGGGVCQVSSTFFRAALNTGLPIVERHAHAYRVHYYEDGGFKAGLDATVFDPSVDFKIKNDTGNYILIQTNTDMDNLKLTFDLYGTRDGRNAQIYDFKMWDVSPPPENLYQDDPTLKKGVVKQVDWAAWGAKASFKYKVTRGDTTLQETEFVSVFRPWQAVYLRGTME